MEKPKPDVDAVLAGVNESKRMTARRFILKGVFVAPAVTSVAMSGLVVDAIAAAPNTTASGRVIPSDRRLKVAISRIGTHRAGFGIYRFKYIGRDREHVGVLAQEVRKIMPHAVVEGDDGFLRVDYAAIDMSIMPSLVSSEAAPH